MARRFTIRQIEYFVAVGELGAIALAAERLHVSAPSISSAIAQLEAEFGLQLFVRHHAQGVSLTPEGARFLSQAKMLLAQADAMHGVADEILSAVRGDLSVGALVTFAPLVLPGLRRSFETANPEARMRLVSAHPGELIESLRHARIDAALTYDLQIPADIAFAPLIELAPMALVAADHPLAAVAETDLETLVDEPLVLLDLPLSRDYFLSLFDALGRKPRIADRSSDPAVVRSMVANRFGYTLINTPLATPFAPDGRRVAATPLAGRPRPAVLGLATLRARAAPRILSAFATHCREWFRESEVFADRA